MSQKWHNGFWLLICWTNHITMSTKTISVLVLYINIPWFHMSFKATTFLACFSKHQLLYWTFPGNSSSCAPFKPMASLVHLSRHQFLWHAFQGIGFYVAPFQSTAPLACISRQQLLWHAFQGISSSETSFEQIIILILLIWSSKIQEDQVFFFPKNI